MVTLFSKLTVTDAEAVIAQMKSLPQEALDEQHLVELKVYNGTDENTIFIVNQYNTLEDAQKHAAYIKSDEYREHAKKEQGIESFDLWLAEEA